MQDNTLKIQDEFQEIDTRSVDERNRLTISGLFDGTKRVKLYKNNRGEVLLQPIVEVPASEMWLFQNKKAFNSVKEGLTDAAKGKISNLNISKL